MSFPRLRSLRLRALLVVAVVVVTPLAMVWLSDVSDRGTRLQLAARLEAALTEAADQDDLISQGALSRERGVWLRRLEPQRGGGWTTTRDLGQADALQGGQANLFFGPEGPPSLVDWDAAQAPLPQRPEVVQALDQGAGQRCAWSEDNDLLVCATARRVGEAVLHLQTGSPRAIRSLHDARYQMIKLTLAVGAVGLLLGAWLGWRMVRPVELLRSQVRDRARTGSTAPVVLPRRDEFGELAQAFNTLLAELERRSQANEAFTTDLVHELKNPIAAVRAAAEALQPGRPLTPERAARLARVLEDSSARLDTVATRFLDLARAEAGLAGLPREPVRLDVLVDRLARDTAPGGEAELQLEALSVLVAPERMETLLRNLLDNAWHHAGAEGRVRVVLQGTSAGPRLRVEDSGPGVPEADRERVFDRFFSRREGGTGVGLALARAIAQAHGGSLTVVDSPLGGAAFELQLPNSTVT